jgi:hypothetical protein
MIALTSSSFLRMMLEIAESSEPTMHVVYSSVQFNNVNGEELYYHHPAPYLGFIQKLFSIVLHPNAIYPMVLLKNYPFEILPGTSPRDREQVYEMMKEAT